jgi:hypothetical protein
MLSTAGRVVSAEPAARLPTVLLRHVLPDGSWHVDWMLAQDPGCARRLVTFRLARRVDEMAAGAAALSAERLADHRSLYLDYEGPVAPSEAGGSPRGSGTRLCRGTIERWTRDEACWTLHVTWAPEGSPPHRQAIRLRRVRDDRWTVESVDWSRGP